MKKKIGLQKIIDEMQFFKLPLWEVKRKERKKMTKAKNIEYKNGMKFSCGPPRVSGGYEKWNWCKKCDAIYDKSHKMCKDCRQCLRQSARSNNNWYTADGTKRTKGDTR